MKTIPLTKGYVAVVDDEDYERVSQYKWCANVSGHTVYAMRRVSNKNISLHRQIMDHPTEYVDHVNGNGLDNRRSNLRLATHAQNTRNRRHHKNNTSGFRGVCKSGSRWIAQIKHKGHNFYLGTYATAEQAARIYDAKASEFFGEFARPNFVEAQPMD